MIFNVSGGGAVLPQGGVAGQVLTKTANGTEWAKAPGQPPNLLDNSDFTNPVNQRMLTEGNFNWGNFIDRWLAFGDGFAVSENGITIPAGGQFAQRLPLELGKKLGNLTFVVTLSTGETIITKSTTTSNNIQIIVAYGASNTLFNVIIRNNSSGATTLKNCALYEGEYTAETLPECQPKGYAAELAECLRYFERINAVTSFHPFAVGVLRYATTFVGNLQYSKKRISTPTVSCSGAFRITSSAVLSASDITFEQANDNSILVKATVASGGTAGDGAILQADNSSASYFDISADL